MQNLGFFPWFHRSEPLKNRICLDINRTLFVLTVMFGSVLVRASRIGPGLLSPFNRYLYGSTRFGIVALTLLRFGLVVLSDIKIPTVRLGSAATTLYSILVKYVRHATWQLRPTINCVSDSFQGRRGWDGSPAAGT